MAQIPGSLAEAQEMYALYVEAEKKVVNGQEYYIRDRRLRMADMSEITDRQVYWRSRVIALTANANGGLQVQRIVPMDD